MALEVMAKAEAPISLNVSFRAEAGELLALVGHSGSGKTTLLRTVAGLWRPSAASVKVGDETWLDTSTNINLPTHKRRVGMVFQSYALFPHMTAVENLMAAMDVPDRREAERILDLVNLNGLAGRKPAQMSGGQQQRVAVARALARRPKVLLLDEPFSAVDRATREKLYAEIIELRRHLAMPVVLVTHDMNEAELLADRMVVIERGQVVREGPAGDVMADPEALRAMGIREIAAMLPAVIFRHSPDGITELATTAGPLFVPGIEGEPGARLRVRILAREVILSRSRPEGLSAQNILPGSVRRVVSGTGPAVLVHVAMGDHEIVARITRRAADQLALTQGTNVHCILKSMSVTR